MKDAKFRFRVFLCFTFPFLDIFCSLWLLFLLPCLTREILLDKIWVRSLFSVFRWENVGAIVYVDNILNCSCLNFW
jgi:hypothetical protein